MYGPLRIPFVFVIIALSTGCASDRTLVSKSGFSEGWQDETRYHVIGIAGHTYAGASAKYASAEACREAKEKIPRRFSEALAGVDDGRRCFEAESTGDPFCDWNYRLDPAVFTFRGKEIHRRHDFRTDSVICEIVVEYQAADLKNRAALYQALLEKKSVNPITPP